MPVCRHRTACSNTAAVCLPCTRQLGCDCTAFISQHGCRHMHILSDQDAEAQLGLWQAAATRDYLHSLSQSGQTLPVGPVITSPDGLFPSLYRELVLRRPHEFKIRSL